MTSGQESRKVRVTHESRLLLLTIVVCVIVLLLLARLRFPEPPPVVETAVQPLERLAARASYEALAGAIEHVEGLVSPSLVVLRTMRRVEPAPRGIADVLLPPGEHDEVRHVAALRIDDTSAVAAISPGVRIAGIIGSSASGGTAAVMAVDPVRRIGRIRVPTGPARPVAPVGLQALRTPVYVVAAEGTQAGVTLRPIFLGRGNRFESPRWGRPLLPLGGTGVAPGALLFSLDGEFVGCVVVEDGATAIAGAGAVLEAAERLASPAAGSASSLGVAVQPLTPDLGAALGATRGVIVAEVDPAGPAAGVLQAGDVITEVDGRPVSSPEDVLLAIAAWPPAQPVSLSLIREGKPMAASAAPVPADAAAPTRPDSDQRLAFERSSAAGTHVVASDGGYRIPGLRPGDVVIAAGDLRQPTPARLQRLLEGTGSRSLVVFTVRRDGRQRLVAVALPVRDE